MKTTLKNTFFLLLLITVLAGCTPTASKDLNVDAAPQNNAAQAPRETPLNEASMEAAQKREVENLAVHPPEQKTPSEPPLPVLPNQEDINSPPPITDPQVLKAGSAKTLKDCESYQGNLKEICLRSVGFPSGENTPVPSNEQN